MAASRFALTSALLVMFTGCGGGTTAEDSGVSIPPLGPFFPGGIWEGTVDQSHATGPRTIVGVISENGRAQLHAHYLYVFDVTRSTINTSINVFTPIGSLFPSGNSVEPGNVTGALIDRDSLMADFNAPGFATGAIRMTYNADLYERSSSLRKVTGMWGFLDTVITINADGRIRGQKTNGCIISGRLSLIDSRYNSYDLSVDLDMCFGLTGSYSGLAYLTDRNDGQPDEIPDGQIQLLASSDQHSFIFGLRKM